MEEPSIRLSEIFILIFIILISFLDFFEVLPGDVDFAKKILSWLLLGYLLYRISLTQLFFGVKKKSFDLLIVLTYFLLIIKNLVGFAGASIEEANLLLPLYEFLVHNSMAIEMYCFNIGGILLILLSFIMAFMFEIKKPSLMEVIHEEGTPLGAAKMLKRFLSTFFVLTFFFIVVFNLVMEWLAIAVDASLIVAAFIFYMFTMFRSHYKKLNPTSFLYRVGDVGEEFYENFIALFHSKERIFLGISGLLVLHLLTDVANFIIPYLVGFHDVLYFSQLGANHEALYLLFLKDAVLTTTILQKVFLSLIYLFNIFAMLFLLILPAYIWHELYKREGFFVSDSKLSLFFMTIMTFILVPVFKIQQIKVESLVGVDIITKQILPLNNITLITISILAAGILFYFLGLNHYIKEKLIALGIILVDIFFGLYIYLFFMSTALYYMETINLLWVDMGKYFIAFYFAMFFIITCAFYIIGFFIFLAETKREFRYIE